MLTFFIFTLITIYGYLLVSVIIKDLQPLEKIGLGYLLGLGTVTFAIFVYSWAGIKITAFSILLLILLLILITYLLNFFLKRGLKLNLKKIHLEISNFNVYEKIILGVIFFILFLSLVLSSYYPITAWDALALYDFRGKVIANRGFFVQIANQYEYFAHYPLLTSLTHTIVYLFGGANPQFTYSLYVLSLAIIFYQTLIKHSSRLVSLLVVLVLVTTPEIFEHSTIAYTNLPYTVTYVTGIIYFSRFFDKKNNMLGFLFLSGILIGLSTWARSIEPFWITPLVIIVAYSLFKRKLYILFVYLLPFLLIRQSWNMFLTIFYGNNYSTVSSISSSAVHIPALFNIKVLVEITRFLFNSVFIHIKEILFMFVTVLLFDIKKLIKSKNNIFLMVIIINLMLLFVGTFLFRYRFKGWEEIPDSARRMAMFLIPMYIYYIGNSGLITNIFRR